MAITPTSAGNDPTLALDSDKLEQKRLWHPFSRWLGKKDQTQCHDVKEEACMPIPRSSLGRRLSRKVVPSLPRPATFKRQNSERREHLTPVDPASVRRRALSVDRRRSTSARPSSPALISVPKLSAPAIYGSSAVYHGSLDSFPQLSFTENQNSSQDIPSQPYGQHTQNTNDPPDDGPPNTADGPEAPGTAFDDQMDEEIRRELEDKWILNLSMHFRDRSPREKFFVTYAETPTRWRRVTVSIDYRHAPPDSLERDLQALQYQRDKSARVYEAIRTSLLDIQFYDTVTNLRLETSADDRLHVHVTEDVNEIIQYPSVNAVQHLNFKRVPECDVHFDSHMSGFVYKVRVNDGVCIKKEIPGPDSVEEFLYEINALYSLVGAQNVIQFEGLVVDEGAGLVKGLLISYAEQGPLVDLIYDDKGHLSWERRQKWAKQIVKGLSEIHEAGFVQGDFTLSNIVIDEQDRAQIIDINRRGCPVGWEPPEIARMIESGQRISMYIGVKSDLYQLGMVLWALAEEEDEPERQHRPLSLQDTKQLIPTYFRQLTASCLSDDPRTRLSASSLLSKFPPLECDAYGLSPPVRFRSVVPHSRPQSIRTHSLRLPSETEYIDPATAVDRNDILVSNVRPAHSREFSDSHTYFDRPSSIEIPFDGPGSYIVPRRGRTPTADNRHLDRPVAEACSIGTNGEVNDEPNPQIVPVSPAGDHTWEEFQLNGHSFLVGIDENDQERTQRRERSHQRMREAGLNSEVVRQMEHIDSGLADMDDFSGRRTQNSAMHSVHARAMAHVDSGLADMDLAGVGENEALVGYHGRGGFEAHEEDADFGIIEEKSEKVEDGIQLIEEKNRKVEGDIREVDVPEDQKEIEETIKEKQGVNDSKRQHEAPAPATQDGIDARI